MISENNSSSVEVMSMIPLNTKEPAICVIVKKMTLSKGVVRL